MASTRKLSRRSFVQAGAGAAALLAAPRAFADIGKVEKPKLTLGVAVPGASFLPVYVAAARTWKEMGLDVNVVRFRGDAEVSQAMAGDSIDLSVQSPDGLINMINAGQGVKAFYAGFHQADFGGSRSRRSRPGPTSRAAPSAFPPSARSPTRSRAMRCASTASSRRRTSA